MFACSLKKADTALEHFRLMAQSLGLSTAPVSATLPFVPSLATLLPQYPSIKANRLPSLFVAAAVDEDPTESVGNKASVPSNPALPRCLKVYLGCWRPINSR